MADETLRVRRRFQAFCLARRLWLKHRDDPRMLWNSLVGESRSLAMTWQDDAQSPAGEGQSAPAPATLDPFTIIALASLIVRVIALLWDVWKHRHPNREIANEPMPGDAEVLCLI